MEDSQADSIGCQALIHPSGLRIVLLGVIFVLGIPSAPAPKGPLSSCPGPDWLSEAVLGPGQGSRGPYFISHPLGGSYITEFQCTIIS